MKRIPAKTKVIEAYTNKEGKIYPKCTVVESFYPEVIDIENKFLTALINSEQALCLMEGEWTILSDYGSMIISIYQDHVYLDAISIQKYKRRKGYGKELMECLTKAADESGTIIKLKTLLITRGAVKSRYNHEAIIWGSVRENRIPLKELALWFKRFGFTKSKHHLGSIYDMERKPITKNS